MHSSYCASAHAKCEKSLPPIVIPLQPESNERLEFLGDAVLDMIVAEYLYERYPGEDEGFLTKMRANLVNGRMLARLGRIINVQRFLLLSQNSEHLRDTDSAVEDAFEALVGAIFLDRGLACAKTWFLELVEGNLNFATFMEHGSDKDMLERFYREKFSSELNMVATEKESGTFTARIFEKSGQTLVAEGTGRTRRDAVDDASRRALRQHHL